MTVKAVLFDLDGTLLDTAEDLGLALNHLLRENNYPLVPKELVRPAAGSGCRGLLKLGMSISPEHPRYTSFAEKLLDLYGNYIIDNTVLFPGMEETLKFIEQKEIPWGIVTNKPVRFTEKLVSHLRLNLRTQCVVSGDSLRNRKPHPEPILHACEFFGLAPKDCLYVGDSAIDVQACKSAGVPVLAALYGYIPDNEDPLSWQADGYINHPTEIISWLAD
jgi:2-phosphoglycolate phosphatase